jgi:hypothetical protein
VLVPPVLLQGILPAQWASRESLDESQALPARPGSFDCVGLRFAKANSAQDDSLFIDSLAKQQFRSPLLGHVLPARIARFD